MTQEMHTCSVFEPLYCCWAPRICFEFRNQAKPVLDFYGDEFQTLRPPGGCGGGSGAGAVTYRVSMLTPSLVTPLEKRSHKEVHSKCSYFHSVLEAHHT